MEKENKNLKKINEILTIALETVLEETYHIPTSLQGVFQDICKNALFWSSIFKEKENKTVEQNNLNKYKILEQKLGCPLDVLLQVFKNGIYVKNDCTKNKIEYWDAQKIKIIDNGNQYDICLIGSKTNKYVGCFNYGKTWNLKKDDLVKNYD